MPNSLIADCLELKRLGWVAIKGNLSNVAPKCMIFGGIFNNKEGKLPSKNGRVRRSKEMEYITLDFTGCTRLGEIHRILKESFGFPEYYGENLDALWDCLEYYCDYDLHVYIKGLSDLPEEFNGYVIKMIEIFDDVHEETPNITFEIMS